MSENAKLVLRFGDAKRKEVGQLAVYIPKADLTLAQVQPVADMITSKKMFCNAKGKDFEVFLGAEYEDEVVTKLA